MLVIFRRIGQRRYAVEAKRELFPDLEMNPAPGYDPIMPHDLLHLVVEAQLGLRRGIFGQLATGGDAGTFHPTFKANEKTLEIARIRKRVKARGKKLLKEGQEESARSERATYICLYEWRARSQSSEPRTPASSTTQQAKQVRPVANESGALDESKVSEICMHLDQLSERWSNLEIGQSLAVHWPDLSIANDGELS